MPSPHLVDDTRPQVVDDARRQIVDDTRCQIIDDARPRVVDDARCQIDDDAVSPPRRRRPHPRSSTPDARSSTAPDARLRRCQTRLSTTPDPRSTMMLSPTSSMMPDVLLLVFYFCSQSKLLMRQSPLFSFVFFICTIK